MNLEIKGICGRLNKAKLNQRTKVKVKTNEIFFNKNNVAKCILKKWGHIQFRDKKTESCHRE